VCWLVWMHCVWHAVTEDKLCVPCHQFRLLCLISLIPFFFCTFFLHFSLCALWYNCYKIRPTKCTHFNVLIYKTPTCFGPHWPIIRECSCTKLSLGHPVICIIQNCGENVSVCYTQVNMYTKIIKYLIIKIIKHDKNIKYLLVTMMCIKVVINLVKISIIQMS
jgi:hypothetical protein